MKLITFCLFFLFSVATCFPTDIVSTTRNVTVLVSTKTSQGTGLVITRSNITYVLTAAHIFSEDVKFSGGFMKGGSLRETFECPPVKITKWQFDNYDRVIEKNEVTGQLIKYSSSDSGFDLAFIKVDKLNYTTNSVIFDTNNVFRTGDEVWSCNNLDGLPGAYSISKGVMAFKYREIAARDYHQVDIVIREGASGGGLFLPNGNCIGILVRRRTDNIGFSIVPEDIVKFCRKFDIIGIIHPSLTIDETKEFGMRF